MTIDVEAFCETMGQLASGVSVVTMHAEGEDHGFTATSVTSLSVVPMLVLVCVAENQRCHAQLERAGNFAINMLAGHQTELGVRFASALVEERFAGLTVTRAVTGAPLLADCLAWLDCRIQQVLPGGDHSIVIGEVLAAEAQGVGDPLVYFRRQWGSFQTTGSSG